MGTKLAIVADKPQTTRTLIQGIWSTEDAQVIFMDTPGIHKPDSLINRRMMDAVRAALDQRDLLLYVADGNAPLTAPNVKRSRLIGRSGTPAFLRC